MLEFAENAWLCYEREAAANSAVSCDCCGSTSWRTAQPAMSKLGACGRLEVAEGGEGGVKDLLIGLGGVGDDGAGEVGRQALLPAIRRASRVRSRPGM